MLIALQAKHGKLPQCSLTSLLLFSVKGAVQRHIVQNGFPRQQQVVLWHIRKVRGYPLHLFSIHKHLAVLRLQHPRQNVQQRAFAAARGPDECHKLPCPHRQVQIFQYSLVFKGDGNVFDLQFHR